MCFRNAVTAAVCCPVLLYDDSEGMDVQKGILRECPSPCKMGENVTKVNSFAGGVYSVIWRRYFSLMMWAVK